MITEPRAMAFPPLEAAGRCSNPRVAIATCAGLLTRIGPLPYNIGRPLPLKISSGSFMPFGGTQKTREGPIGAGVPGKVYDFGVD
jgi:hypothetical protein